MAAAIARRRELHGGDGLRDLLSIVRPDAEFSWDAELYARRARRKLDAVCATQVGVLEGLDANRRVIVTGSAGTGKTRLAVRWVSRALGRGERVLFVCCNDPLGFDLRERMPFHDRLVVGQFLSVTRALEGMPDLEVPEGAAGEWWATSAFGHLDSNWHRIKNRFAFAAMLPL